MYELGFTKKAYEDLENLLTSDNRFARKLAAWELALWHANQYTVEDSKKSLQFLKLAEKSERNVEQLRKLTILKAECYEKIGELQTGRNVISRSLEKNQHPDLYLAMANLELTIDERLKWINKALALFTISPVHLESKSTNAYDALTVAMTRSVQCEDQPKVSVIMPVYNAEKVIRTSVDSILSQTWSNLELIVVDDCSTDNTVKIIEQYEKNDSRVKVIKAPENRGAYVARNLAMQIATGEFVTVNDADDWSHPEKIEKQATHLIKNKTVIANTSQQARATEDLVFYRRGKPGSYLFANMSSLMFRRQPVIDKLGYWDCVRFGADGEFKRRLKYVFGEKAVEDLATGPYSFQRQSNDSLLVIKFSDFTATSWEQEKSTLTAINTIIPLQIHCAMIFHNKNAFFLYLNR
ncbi:MAG: glycosyltransferase [Bacillaceae bacterium]|nr:glycosyltransferase [Bacillaceae bacterium]